MKIYARTLLLVVSFMLSVTHAAASDQTLPVIDGKEVAAMVNDEPIFMEEYVKFLASIEHGDTSAQHEHGPEKIDYAGILNRIVSERLLLIEARNIGLNEGPDVIEAIEKYTDMVLMKTLVAEQLKNITADQEEVEKLFRPLVREFKITSIVFENEKDAEAMDEALKSGGEFDDLAKKSVEDGSSKENHKGIYLQNRALLPEISAVVSEMEIGALSTVIALDQTFVLLRLDDIRYPENKEIRSKVEMAVVEKSKIKALEEYTETLIKKYVKKDDALLESIDYDTTMEDFNKLLKDERAIARIKKGSPVTVGALSAHLEKTFHHGIEGSIIKKEVNNKKEEALYELLQKIVLKKEAVNKGLAKTDKYKTGLENYQKSMLLSSFIQKVVAPDIKLTEDEVRVYYEENAENYTSPEMMRIEGLVFNDMGKAEETLEKLRNGTDIKWLRSNVEGQVSEETAEILSFKGSIINPDTLPADVRKALEGASSGDHRLYESSQGHFYALYIQNVFPSEPISFDNAKTEIANKLYNDKLVRAIDDWTNQLKEHYTVEIYLKEF